MRGLTLTLATLATLTSAEALACGGFFCQNSPIDQSKERIVFGIDEDNNTVETHVQIFYQGSAEEFSWVVPVPGVPELGLSTDSLFTMLDAWTAPQFYLQWEERGTCNYDSWYGPLAGGVEEDAANFDDSDAAGGGVTVVAAGQVGPYDQVTLQAQSAEALLTWLGDNGYTIPEAIAGNLAPYVADGSYFIALKLQKDKDTGDIAPIRFTYPGDGASIPLVLTAIAATPDMRLQPYVFASSRAVPDNYLHVKINEAAIDWVNYGNNYDAVITQAANEAGGQAFATDFAGPTTPMRGRLWSAGRYDLEALSTLTDPAEFVQGLMDQGFPSSSQLLNLFRQFIPMPQSLIDQGVSDTDWYNCLECYEETDEVVFDPAAFAAALDEVIVQPMKDAEQLFTDHAYLTRMTSSMSADEMTSDPLFVLNPDMGDVSNQHTADYIVDCGDGGNYSESPQWIELADGTVILMPPGAWYESQQTWTYETDLDGIAAASVEDTTGAGQPVTLSDRGDDIDAAVEAHNAGVRAIYDELKIELPDELNGDTARACGCDTATPKAGFALAGLFGALLLRRRR
jgi:MYXO-CTERM domain-containing protein